MIFQRFVVPATGCASYLVGCERAGVAAVVDPLIDVEPYLATAAGLSLRVTHVLETHLHADHLSGAWRLRAVTGAPVLAHEAAPREFPFAGVEDGEEHELGTVWLTALHTPGHTPDGVSIVVSDRREAARPRLVLTGDTLLAGAVGLPEPWAGISAEALAEQLHGSLHHRLLTLPDEVEVHAGHARRPGGNGHLASSTSTIGAERRHNPSLGLATRSDFVHHVLADLPAWSEAREALRRRNQAGG